MKKKLVIAAFLTAVSGASMVGVAEADKKPQECYRKLLPYQQYPLKIQQDCIVPPLTVPQSYSS